MRNILNSVKRIHVVNEIIEWLNLLWGVPVWLYKHLRITLTFATILAVFFLIALPFFYAQDNLGLGPLAGSGTPEAERAKTLWDWLDLLIVPAILAGGALWFNSQAKKREEDRANDRYREEALQKYFDSMLEMLLKNDLARGNIDAAVMMRTTSVLRRMNPDRVLEVLNFLRDYGRVNTIDQIKLQGINLNRANLAEFDLSDTDLTGANLEAADLSSANLNGANLTNANLNGADLRHADLGLANLQDAILDDAKFNRRTTLPDGAKWTPRINLARYTNSNPPSATT